MLKFFLLQPLILQIGLYFSVGIPYPRILRSRTQPEFSQASSFWASVEFFLPPWGIFKHVIHLAMKRKNIPWFYCNRPVWSFLIISQEYSFFIQHLFYTVAGVQLLVRLNRDLVLFGNIFGTETQNSGVNFSVLRQRVQFKKKQLLKFMQELRSYKKQNKKTPKIRMVYRISLTQWIRPKFQVVLA